MFARGRNLCRTLFFLLFVLAAALPALAAESYLDVVPGTALCWGAVNHMDAAADKVQELAKVVQAPATNILATMKKESGLEKGLDDKGAAGFFVVPGKTDEDASVVAVFVAVSDEKDFLSNFDIVKQEGKISEVTPKGPAIAEARHLAVAFLHGYAVISPKTDRVAVEAAVEAKGSVAAEMAGYESWLAENDASFVGTTAGIKYAAEQAAKELKKPGGNSPDATAEFMQMMEGMQKSLGKTMETAPKEISLFLAGIRCDKQSAIRVIARARLVSGGELSKAVAKIPLQKENLLAGVPGGPFLCAMAGVGIPGLMDKYSNFTVGLMKSMKSLYNMSDEEMEKAAKESLEAFRQVHSLAFVWRMGKHSDPFYSNMYGTMQVDDSRHYLETQTNYAKNFGKLMQGMKSSSVKSMSAKPLTIGGKPALEQEMTFDFANMPGTEASRGIMDQVIGAGGKMVIYNVAADEHTVIMGLGVPQERMVSALDVLKQPKRSLAEDADIAVTSAMLPENSQWVAYFSFRGLVQAMTRLTMAAMKNVQGAPEVALPSFPKSPPLGLSIKATPDEIRADLAVPPALVQATGDYFKEMQATMMRQMMERNHPPAP